MTSKQISIKLQEAGFEAVYTHYWYKDMCLPDMDGVLNDDSESHPAYDTDTLLDWLKLNWADKFEITISDTVWLRVVEHEIEGHEIAGIARFEYTTSWSDLLAEAILFILKEE